MNNFQYQNIDEILSMYRFHLNQTSQKTQQRILTSEVKRIVKNHQLKID